MAPSSIQHVRESRVIESFIIQLPVGCFVAKLVHGPEYSSGT
ncbi:hypothetical protein BTN50_0005 [Candidatus Enterovibrio altilux]|uniref:Uncharacterized protein n=1 Tax=Candidatus Enterovibrio altilux TaxID=1927128 RepID=A0A291B6C5_9GAMM|nr:hypothetical protein BTN50_0005 [Candidatus Enterovibrio luxaltus]